MTLVGAGVTASMLLTGCSSGGSQSSSSPNSGKEAPHTVSIMANWLPESEQGGYWQAAAENLAKPEGVTIKIKAGGPGVQTVTNVAIGDADYGMTAADNIYAAQNQGIPVVGIFAPLQHSPQCLMSHPQANVKTFSDLDGKNVAVAPAGSYWLYLKSKYNIKPKKQLPTVSLANWKADPNMVLQCSSVSEPYQVQQNGWKADYLMVSQSGYDPYFQVLFTTEDRIREHPQEVAAVVKAVQKGWQQFLNGDSSAGENAILKANPQYTKGQSQFTIDGMKKLAGDSIGAMTADRWHQTYNQLVGAKVISSKVKWQSAFSLKFLPKG